MNAQIWIPDGPPSVQRVLSMPASKPPTFGNLQSMLTDKVERLLIEAGSTGPLAVEPSLEEAVAGESSTRDQAVALVQSELVYSLMSQYAETQAPFPDLARLRQDLKDQTLGSWAEDVAASLG